MKNTTLTPGAPWEQPAPLWAGRILVGAVVAWILQRVWSGLFIPWWFNTDELVFYYEVVRQLRLDPSQTFFDIPGTPYMALTSLLTAAWWVIERVLGLSQAANPSDFAFEHIQGVYTLMRSLTLGCYAAAIGLSFSVFRQAGGIVTGVFAAILAATLPIHVHYSHFVRTESLGLVLCLLAILSLLHPRTARRWQTYLFAGILSGIAIGARFHFALTGAPVLLAIYFLQDRPHLNLEDEKLPRRLLLNAGAALAALFVFGGVIAVLFRLGVISPNGLTHTLLLSTPAGDSQYPGAKRTVAKLWMLLGTGSLSLFVLYHLTAVRDRLRPLVNPFTLALGLGLAGGFLLSHPTFLWRGEFQLRSIQFYSDWVDPNLEAMGMGGSWWNVTQYYFTTALPEKWLQLSFLAGIGTILWSRNPLSISFLIGAAICFVAHPVTMKLWPHHIIPWLPFLCFVAAHPFGVLLLTATRNWRNRRVPTLVVAGSTALLLAVLSTRFAKADNYVQLSRARTTQIEEMNRWLTIHVPLDSFIAISYYALNGDCFMKSIESVGVSVPSHMILFPDTHNWLLQRNTLIGHAGYACLTRADIVFFRADAERKNPGSTYNPFEDKRFEELATFGSGVYELKVFKFDLRSEPQPAAATSAQEHDVNFQATVGFDGLQPNAAKTAQAVLHKPVEIGPGDRAGSARERHPNEKPDAQNASIDAPLREQDALRQTVLSLQAQVESLTLAAQRRDAYAAILKKEYDRLESERGPLMSQLGTLTATSRQQSEYITGLEKERDRLKAAPEANKRQLESLIASTKKQTEFIATLENEHARLKAEQDTSKRQLEALAATARQHVDYIAELEKERDRLKAEPETIRRQFETLAGTARQQADYISILEKERDRLTALSSSRDKDIEHYVKVINEQTAYIKNLQSQLPPSKP